MPYPADTEIIANVVISPHHLGATMVTEELMRDVRRAMPVDFSRRTPFFASDD